MKISLGWLQSFVDLDILGFDVSQVSEALTTIGLAVEGVEETADDQVLDVDITSNRPDCLNHLGVARELATQFRLKLSPPNFEAPETHKTSEQFPAEIEILDPDLCPRYAGRIITDIRIAESPDWLKARLEAIGQRPINNIVDITNYVLFEVGQPLHAFDYEKLEGRKIVVRRAIPGERIRTLDDVGRTLDDQMLMICDAVRPVAVAGVMGGADSEISESSKTILLESAFFHPPSIRSTSRSLALSTEASYRFERGADPDMPVKALNLACRLIEEICGGRYVSPVMDEHPKPFLRSQLRLRYSRVEKVLGVPVSSENIKDILQRLEFQPGGEDEENSVLATTPSFRTDISVEDDLVEEVARHIGYDQIPSSYPVPGSAGRFSSDEPFNRLVVETLVDLGFFEAMNYTFTVPGREAALLGEAPAMIPIANPLTEVDTHLRTMLLPGLLDSLKQNLNFGSRDIRLFELGKVFLPGQNEDFGDHIEEKRLGVVATGDFHSPYWAHQPEEMGFFHLKGILNALSEKLGIETDFQQESGIPYLHPGISASLHREGQKVGVLGELHPRIAETFKFTSRVLVAEISFDRLCNEALSEPLYRRLGRFPSVERDLSFLLDSEVPFSKIRLVVQALRLADLKNLRLIDLYQGKNLPQGKISLTVRFTFEDPLGTLTQDRVNERYERVVSALRSQLGIEPR